MVLGVRITRSGLGQTATDEVGAGDDRDVEPCLAGDELVGPVGVATLDYGGADENRNHDADHCPKLGGLEGLLGLSRQAANPAVATDWIGAHGTGLGSGFHRCCLLFFDVLAWAVQGDRRSLSPLCSQTGWTGCFAFASNDASLLLVYPLASPPKQTGLSTCLSCY